MAGVNKVILVGNLGADPEARSLNNGGEVVNMRVATSESWKDRDGNRQFGVARPGFFGTKGELVMETLDPVRPQPVKIPHLRNVYQTAIRRGVPREVLIDYRDRWADLRETDNDDPAHLIQGYGALAYDLGREARDDREGAARRRNPSGLRALANALAPWW